MKSIKQTCLGIVLVALLGWTGCSAGPTSDPSQVQRVDPLTNKPITQSQQSGADPSDTAGAPDPGVQVTGEISLARNIYFVIDGSGSMNDAPPSSAGSGTKSFGSKIEGAKWAVHAFLSKVPNDVNLGLYVFDNGGQREVLALGPNNRQEFLQDVDNIVAGSGTPLGDAIAKGTDALVAQYKKQLGYGEYKLIVVTDGEATDDLNTGVSEAMKYAMPIYTIGFGIGEDHALRRYSVQYKSADSAKDVEQALEATAAELDVFDSTAFPHK